MIKKIINTSTLLLMFSNLCFANFKDKDWSYSSNDLGNICIAETSTQSQNTTYKLQLSISKDITQISNISIVVKNSGLAGLKVMSGQTNNSNNELINFLALKKVGNTQECSLY